MDKGDFIILENLLVEMIGTIEQFNDPSSVFFVPNAAARGMIEVGKWNNSEKRIIGSTKISMAQTEIEPEELDELDALQSYNRGWNYNLEKNRKQRRNTDNDLASYILKFCNIEIDEDHFRISERMFLTDFMLWKDNLVRSVILFL
jgi:hypothetical protein